MCECRKDKPEDDNGEGVPERMTTVTADQNVEDYTVARVLPVTWLKLASSVAVTMQRHRDGILAWFDSRITNGLIEGINGLVQAAKAKARGYRSTRNLKAVTYLIAGKLDLRLPT